MTDSIPGFRTIVETEENQLYAAGPDNQHKKFQVKVHIKSTTVDSGNSPTTTLRGGVALALKDSDGYAYKYDGSANDGTQCPVGLLEKHLGMTDRAGTVEDKLSKVLNQCIVRNIDELIGVDKAALATLLRGGVTLAQATPHGSAFGVAFRRRDFKATDYTITDDDHGKMLIATAATNFTLPSLATVGRGFQVFLYNAADANMIITGAADTINYGDAAGGLSTTLTFSTANKKRGGQALLVSEYDNTAGSLVWYVLFPIGAVSA